MVSYVLSVFDREMFSYRSICIYVRLCMYARLNEYVCVCMYVCMYVCVMCVCTSSKIYEENWITHLYLDHE
jgi:hypothetical protein